MMSILTQVFTLLNLNLNQAMILVVGLFQILLVFLFYKYTESMLKTFLMVTSLTFLTFIGQPETAIVSAVFLMLYFLNRDKPYSEFFITIASLIRLDSAIFYLFVRKKTAIIPILITALQWFQKKQFVQSDFGVNQFIPQAAIGLLFGFGAYLILFIAFGKLSRKFSYFDAAIHAAIPIVLLLFLKFPSQKVFFFPIIMTFFIYDLDFRQFKKYKWYILFALMLFSLVAGVMVQFDRSNLCTQEQFYDFASHQSQSIYFGVFQPYLDYYNITYTGPYPYEISQSCSNSTDHFLAEDWRNSQLFYNANRFCVIESDGRFD